MASEIKPVIVILWEQEIRAAAKAFSKVDEVFKDDSSSEEAKAKALKAAISAGLAALAGVRDEAALVLSSVPQLFHRAKEEPNV